MERNPISEQMSVIWSYFKYAVSSQQIKVAPPNLDMFGQIGPCCLGYIADGVPKVKPEDQIMIIMIIMITFFFILDMMTSNLLQSG